MSPVSLHFNSIKVQLEPENQYEKGRAEAFQFHKGTIRTDFDGLINISGEISIP